MEDVLVFGRAELPNAFDRVPGTVGRNVIPLFLRVRQKIPQEIIGKPNCSSAYTG